MRFLIVEDNPAMRKTIRKIVASPEDAVMECSDGDEALAAYITFHPDWVLMDYEMERKDGITATTEILHSDSKAKVLVLSQYNDEDIRETAEKAGAYQFIAKQNILDIKKIINH
ncbi:MAG: response regulator transcription factor [Bacteriovoracaceae bacterium]|nr:response regulator transcription factor [Bacteroidota bacterium]